MEEECRQNPIMCGNVWHNQGLIFAKFFLFKEAKDCFETAYKFHMNRESLYAAMAASHFLGEDEEISILAKKHEVEEKDFWEYWNIKQKEVEERDIFANKIESEKSVDLEKMLEEWKKEYRKNCT